MEVEELVSTTWPAEQRGTDKERAAKHTDAWQWEHKHTCTPLTESSLLRPLRDFLLKRNFDHTAALVKFLHQHFISQRINPNHLNSIETLSALLAACLSRLFPDTFPRYPVSLLLWSFCSQGAFTHYGISASHQTNFYSSFRNPLNGTSMSPLISPQWVICTFGFPKRI